MSPLPSLENPLRRKMNRQDLAVGMIVRLVRGVEIVALARMAGIDVLFIDLEHNGFTHETATQLCLAANLAGLTPLVRVGRCEARDIAQALDCGAMGVIVTGIETAADAALAVRAARYPPAGDRSVMSNLPQFDFASVPVASAMALVNDAVMVVAMIESQAALENAASIAAVDGIDMLLVGANDLSNALGHVGDPGHAEVRAGFAHVALACKAAGKFFGVGGLGQQPEIAREIIALGATYVTAGADVTFLANAALAQVRKFR